MRKRSTKWLSGAVAFALCAAGAPAFAQTTPDTKDALKCQTGQSKATAKFVGAKAKCAQKCLSAARKTMGPYTDCTPPYGGATATCIQDPVKGAEAKARASIGKACAKDCPDCYANDTPSNCPNGAGFVATAEGNVDTVGPLVYCLENGGMTPTKEQGKCEDGVAKALTKYVGSFGKAVSKCVTNEFNGKIGAGSCTFTGTTVPDAATQAALDKAQGKAVGSIDKVCVPVPGNPPCYAANLNSGQEWTDFVEAILAGASPNTYCGSPSGAFLD
jgi:hypothetical protein